MSEAATCRERQNSAKTAAAPTPSGIAIEDAPNASFNSPNMRVRRPLSAADPVLRPGGDRLREEAFALGAFTGQFPRPADGLGLPASLGLGRLLVSSAGFHFPEDALALHLLLEGLQRLVDVVVPDHNNYDLKLSIATPVFGLTSPGGGSR